MKSKTSVESETETRDTGGSLPEYLVAPKSDDKSPESFWPDKTVSDELSKLRIEGQHNLHSLEELNDLDERTRLVILFHAVAHKTFVFPEVYRSLKQEFRWAFNGYIGGLTEEGLTRFYCPEVERAANEHQLNFRRSSASHP